MLSASCAHTSADGRQQLPRSLHDALWVAAVRGFLERVGETGLVWLPILGIVLQNVARARASGADEGNAGALSLKRIEAEILVMFLVIVVAALPTYEVRLSSIQYYKPAPSARRSMR